jgi:hypothetical protein
MNMTKRVLLSLSIILLTASLQISCKKSNELPEKSKVSKMVLVYMDANNDLRYEALNSINRMEKGAKEIDGTLLVYIKTSSVRSYLLKIRHDEDLNRITSDTLKVFENPVSDAEFLKDVVKYTQSEHPAETYGLVLWSHATSWAPAAPAKTKSFGRDNGKEMDIIDLKNALPNNFEFIIFDACSMGGVEVLYEFRQKAKYIIASPAETLAESFPYQTITPLLFKSADQLDHIAKAYYDYYNAYSGDLQSATVVLVQTSELDALAHAMKTLMINKKTYGDKLVSEGVQRLDFTLGFPVANYDFGGFLDKNFQPADLSDVYKKLNKAILYKAATTNFLGISIKSFSGLTCYIPSVNDANLNYYKRLQWYAGAGIYVPFEK